MKIKNNNGFIDLKNIKLDSGRLLRCGIPEAIYAPNKSIQDLFLIINEHLNKKLNLLITRLNDDDCNQILIKYPELSVYKAKNKNIIYFKHKKTKFKKSNILIITAGTSDISYAMEAVITLNMSNYNPKTIYDVGVAGLHRLLDKLDEIQKADIIIAFAGMDGVLPGVISGLVDCPVIGVPVSNGYGTGKNGYAALLTMLNSCSSGLTVTNIDNGYGAAAAVIKILKKKK